MTREEIIHLTYSALDNDLKSLWCVSVVWKDKLGLIDNTYCFFADRYNAEKWLTDFVSDGRPYYAYCCDRNFWNNAYELIGGDNNEI